MEQPLTVLCTQNRPGHEVRLDITSGEPHPPCPEVALVSVLWHDEDLHGPEGEVMHLCAEHLAYWRRRIEYEGGMLVEIPTPLTS